VSPGATHRVGLTAVILTAAFAVGTAVPLLAVAAAGGQLTSRIGAIRRRAPQIRRVGGAVLVVFAVLIASDVLAGLQRDIPGYTTALQGSAKIRKQLNALNGTPHTSLSSCDSTATTLVNCGPAPNFTGITAWLNTPGGQPLSLKALRGKVVLVDFWTYSCINCQRSLPHVEAWYQEYAKDVYLVLGGTGTLDVSVNGSHTQTIDVGGTPRLYTLYQAGAAATGTLLLHASPGVEAYDFTFG
jgi:thiol-disulfide isomerase/thioredoxin